MYDVAIIGAGVIGGAIARELMRYRVSVCILEKENDVAMGSTKANSAIVHAGFDAKPGSLKAKLNVRGSNLMPQVTKELGVKYRRNGSMVIGFSEEDEKMIHELYHRGTENGVEQLRILSREEALQTEPNLQKNVRCALLAETGAIVCPYELTVAAIGNAMDNGAELKRNFAVQSIKKQKDYYLISNGTEEVSAKYVVNAAGLYSDKIAAMAGDDSFTVSPRKGEYLLLDKQSVPVVSHTIFTPPTKMGKGILVSPTVDNNILLGPTSVNIQDKSDTQTTKDGFDSVLEMSRHMVQNIPYKTTVTGFCGLRAVGSTGDFIIRAFEKNMIHAAGIESPGLSASFAIAEYVIDLLRGCGLELTENKNFNPIRTSFSAFRHMSQDEKNDVIRKHPAYGKIVCRCEQITEGEILDALTRNPAALDLDGVKRRTRSGMGRCQGGFCSDRIITLLAQAQNIAYEDVTKFGRGSVLNLYRTKEDAQ